MSKAEREKAVSAYLSIFRLRQKLLRQVARRDSQLALEMLRATRQMRHDRLDQNFRFRMIASSNRKSPVKLPHAIPRTRCRSRVRVLRKASRLSC